MQHSLVRVIGIDLAWGEGTAAKLANETGAVTFDADGTAAPVGAGAARYSGADAFDGVVEHELLAVQHGGDDVEGRAVEGQIVGLGGGAGRFDPFDGWAELAVSWLELVDPVLLRADDGLPLEADPVLERFGIDVGVVRCRVTTSS
jgi:hypothetical protein